MVVIEVDKGCLQSSTLQFTEVVLQDTVQNIFVSRDFRQCWECAVLSSCLFPHQTKVLSNCTEWCVVAVLHLVLAVSTDFCAPAACFRWLTEALSYWNRGGLEGANCNWHNVCRLNWYCEGISCLVHQWLSRNNSTWVKFTRGSCIWFIFLI